MSGLTVFLDRSIRLGRNADSEGVEEKAELASQFVYAMIDGYGGVWSLFTAILYYVRCRRWGVVAGWE